jgi:hypothetical protein
VREIYKLGLKHGMRLAAISGVNGPFSDDDIARVRDLALAERARRARAHARAEARAKKAAAAPRPAPARSKRGAGPKTSPARKPASRARTAAAVAGKA